MQYDEARCDLQRKAKKPKLGGAGMKMPDLALERDIMLDSFHAIGKFLYNKREISSSQVLYLHPHAVISSYKQCPSQVPTWRSDLLKQHRPDMRGGCSACRGNRAKQVRRSLCHGAWQGTLPRWQKQQPRRGSRCMSQPGILHNLELNMQSVDTSFMPLMQLLPQDVCRFNTSAYGAQTTLACCRHQRPPMPFDPEVIWQQSQLDFNTTAGFLHENCLHFLEDAAIEDAALEAELFSDSGLRLPDLSLVSALFTHLGHSMPCLRLVALPVHACTVVCRSDGYSTSTSTTG